MILLMHILVAVGSMALATAAFIRPSQRLIALSSSLVTATVLSGTYIVLTQSVHILQTCVTGLLYVGVVTFGLVSARRRLARESVSGRHSQ